MDSNEKENYRKEYHLESTSFSSVRSAKKQDFTIHPDWFSENRLYSVAARGGPRQQESSGVATSISPGVGSTVLEMVAAHAKTSNGRPLSYRERTCTFPPRRSKSAPGVVTRNIITWEN